MIRLSKGRDKVTSQTRQATIPQPGKSLPDSPHFDQANSSRPEYLALLSISWSISCHCHRSLCGVNPNGATGRDTSSESINLVVRIGHFACIKYIYMHIYFGFINRNRLLLSKPSSSLIKMESCAWCLLLRCQTWPSRPRTSEDGETQIVVRFFESMCMSKKLMSIHLAVREW